MVQNYEVTDMMNRDSQPNRYFRNAVERHWDPGEIDLNQDRERLLDRSQELQNEPTVGKDNGPLTFTMLRNLIAMFGAGETEVTEDLAPLAAVLEDIDDQMFVTTQIYEESKHVDFFDRYWREVIHPVEDEIGLDRTDPTDDRWYPQGYLNVLGRNSQAMHSLLEEDTPENRAKAYCHYHLMVEAILAQGGYYVLTNAFDGSAGDMPHLPGLIEGIGHIRADEGRHVGFGLEKTRDLVASGEVSPVFIEQTIGQLVRELVIGGPTTEATYPRTIAHLARRDVGFGATDPVTHIVEKHMGRMDLIRDAAEEIPDADRLTSIDTRANRLTNLLYSSDNVRQPRRLIRAVSGV